MGSARLQLRSVCVTWLLPALVMSADCGDEAKPRPPEVELGTGEAEYEPVTPNEHLMFHAGTQGGHHVWLSYRVYGLEPEGVLMTLDVVPEPPARPAHTEVMLDLDPVVPEGGDPSQADTFEFVGWPAQVLDPECAVGKVVSLELKLTDSLGATVEGTLTVIPDPPTLGFMQTCTL